MMIKDSFRLTILCPEKKLYEGELASMVIPGKVGYLGVLPNHAPMITQLSGGRIRLKESSGIVKTFISVSGGFLEVSGNKATILLDKESV